MSADQLPSFLQFTPVPVRAQRNGWTPDLQRRFILALARGAGPGEAARSLGRTRQGVYRLRDRSDAASFAAAWDRALELARQLRAAYDRRPDLLPGAETVLVPRYYRGRLLGFVQRDDITRLMHAAAQLGKYGPTLSSLRRGGK